MKTFSFMENVFMILPSGMEKTRMRVASLDSGHASGESAVWRKLGGTLLFLSFSHVSGLSWGVEETIVASCWM